MDVKHYLKTAFLFDLKAGFITAVVALPLALAFALASGIPPVMGMYTAVIAGILGSWFGGSRFSITGPTGAMTVLILTTTTRFGIEGLLVAGLLAGIFQIGFGLLKFGKLVKYLPLPIISGFTAGIGIIIFIGQIPNALGLTLVPSQHIWETAASISANLSQINVLAMVITMGTAIVLIAFPKLISRYMYLRDIPASIIALILSTILVTFFGWAVPLLGDIPSGFPSFHLPRITFELIIAVLPSALSIALLGIIESLLCAVVCDGMSGTKHDSNKELISQGVVNVAMPFFGGMPATAAIARSAVNIREGAKTRCAGIYHGIFLLLTLVFFIPTAKLIPKAFIAGILMFVSAKMITINEFRTIFKLSKEDTIVLFVTLFLTVFTDLVIAVQVGMIMMIFLLFIRITRVIDISFMEDYSKENGINAMIYQNPKLHNLVNVYTIHGPFFFGAMNVFDRKVDEHITISKPIIIIRMKYVPFVDSTGVVRLTSFMKEKQRQGKMVFLAELQPKTKETLLKDREFKELIGHESKKIIFEKTKHALNYVERFYQGKP